MAIGAAAAAIGGGSILSGVLGYLGAREQAKVTDRASRRAADAAREGATSQLAELQRQFDIQTKLLEPALQRQGLAGNRFARAMGLYERDFARDPSGRIIDPNVDPTRLGAASAQDTELGQHAFQNTLAAPTAGQDLAVQRAENELLAGRTLGEDVGVQDIADRQLAAPSLQADERFQFAQDTALTGPTFEESPGYRFRVEEAERGLERQLSRGGGNYGARALLELDRRRQGLAAQEYDAYADRRFRDLSRKDAAATAFQGRQAFDVSRQDAATQDFLRRRGIDIGRGDAALQNFFQRRAGDLTRQDQSILNNQRLQEFDLRRSDTNLNNFLSRLAAAGGVGQNVLGQAVGASGAYGANAANAYGGLGGQLANIFQQQGQNQANIIGGGFQNVGNALQGGIQNALLLSLLGGGG